MEMPKHIKRITAVAAVGLAFGAYEHGAEDDRVSSIGLIGKQAIINCDTKKPVVVSPDFLETDIPVASIENPMNVYTSAFENLEQKTTPNKYESLPYTVDSFELLRINVKPNSICYQDNFIEKSQPSFMKNLLSAVADNNELIRAAAKDQTLDEIDFRVAFKDESNGYYVQNISRKLDNIKNDYEHKPRKEFDAAIFKFNSRDDTSPLIISDTIRHELLHALTSKVDMSMGNKIKNLDRAVEFKNACKNLQDIAIKDGILKNENFLDNLNSLKDSYSNDGRSDVMAIVNNMLKTGKYTDLKQRYLSSVNMSECDNDVAKPWDFAMLMMSKNNMYIDDIYKKIYGSKSYTKLGDSLDYDWSQILENNEVFGVLKESTYQADKIKNLRKKSSKFNDINALYENIMVNETKGNGHSYSNWDELVTSTLNVLITYPEKMRDKIQKLDNNQKKAVLKVVEQSTEVFESAHPKEEKLLKHLKECLALVQSS